MRLTGRSNLRTGRTNLFVELFVHLANKTAEGKISGQMRYDAMCTNHGCHPPAIYIYSQRASQFTCCTIHSTNT